MTKYEFPMCHLYVISEMLISSPSQLKLKVDGLCGRNDESTEFSLASPTEYGYNFEIYQHHEPKRDLKQGKFTRTLSITCVD